VFVYVPFQAYLISQTIFRNIGNSFYNYKISTKLDNRKSSFSICQAIFLKFENLIGTFKYQNQSTIKVSNIIIVVSHSGKLTSSYPQGVRGGVKEPPLYLKLVISQLIKGDSPGTVEVKPSYLIFYIFP
jgi:hypothetical protein